MLSRVTPIVLVTLLCVALMTEAAADVDRKRNLGGWTKVPVTDPEVQSVAAKATAHIETARNSARVYRLQEVSSAEYQIVRGKNFKLTLRIGQTDCLRRANVDVEKCSIVKAFIRIAVDMAMVSSFSSSSFLVLLLLAAVAKETVSQKTKMDVVVKVNRCQHQTVVRNRLITLHLGLSPYNTMQRSSWITRNEYGASRIHDVSPSSIFECCLQNPKDV